MRPKTSWLLGATLLLGATAATAQSFPCASVAPEVRERVREAGACRDATPDDAAGKDAAPSSSAVTVSLSDGTVVRVPREISTSVKEGRRRAATGNTAARASASTQSDSDASGDSVSAVKKLGAASAAPSGEVLAQEPAPAHLMPAGSTVSPQVSDGSLANAANTTPVTAPATVAAASMPAPEPTALPEPLGRFPLAFSTNAAVSLGMGVLLGLLFGALLMRQWLLRRELAADKGAAPPTPAHETTVRSACIASPTLARQPHMDDQHQPPVETGAGGLPETGVAPEISFAARLDPGETTIVFAPLPDGDEAAIEQLSDHHA
jgi:hypothetical protein